ncbi:hypothetical protein ACIP25_11500 [Streptomyces massasporeus]|uniref:hypothetical protein n=1 Tax=Streptomyces massasporeus TaxID=67324 RepID=UPI0037F8456B
MAELAHLDADYYDHLPDGTILGKMPFDDHEKLIALLRERMIPENYEAFVNEFVRLYAEKHPEKIRQAQQ